MAKRKHEVAGTDEMGAVIERKSPRQQKLQFSSTRPSKQIHPTAESKSKEKVPRQSPAPAKDDKVAPGRHLQITEQEGDLFAAPPHTVLVHACNARGMWGAGIAAAFKKCYPAVFEVYNKHCKDSTPTELVGTAQLIPPPDEDEEQHFVGNLFTSKSIGKAKDTVTAILDNTGPAVRDLMRQIAEWNANAEDAKAVTGIWMCKINSGLFGVPWEKSKEVIEQLDVPDGDVPLQVKVMFRD